MKIPMKAISSSIYNLNWLTGWWKMYEDNELVEEHWTEAENNTMLGMFRWFKNGEISLTEYMQITKDHDVILLKIRHFDKEFIAWEEKNTPVIFFLVKIDDQTAYFRKKGEENGGYICYEIENTMLKFTDFEENGNTNLSIIFDKY